jgi:hypothetical protein
VPASSTDGPAAEAGLELLGRAGMVAVRAADLCSPAGSELGKDGRTALTVARPGRIATGDLVVFLKPVAVAPAVVRRDGRVQAEVRALLLAERGVRTVFVSLPDLAGPEDVRRLTPLAAAFT